MDQAVAYVTGGGGGIGLAISRALLDRGWRVAICGRDRARLDRAATALEAGDRLLTTQADVTNAEDVALWVGEADERFGPPSLLVLNAGIAPRSSLVELDEEAWNEVLGVNLTGAFLCARATIPAMRAKGGYVVSISSVSGKQGMENLSAYCASKFGLIGLTESLLQEEARHGIRATSICPGFVATEMAETSDPPEQLIQPEDIARIVLSLLDLSPHVVVREIIVERTGAL
jgi:3-oxoacyl-[acyl-carrier protein] reductase